MTKMLRLIVKRWFLDEGKKDPFHDLRDLLYMHEVSFQEGLVKKTIPLSWTANNLESMKKAEILKSLCVNPVAVGLK